MSQRVVRDGRVIVAHLETARTFGRRARGLLGCRGLPPGHGLQIIPCRSIHTWGMLFAIDVLFLDRDETIVRIARNVRPFRCRCGGRRAHSVIEVASGWLSGEAVRVGDRLAIGRSGRDRGHAEGGTV